MDTARTVYNVSADRPGSEVAGETAAALAAASMVFRDIDPGYSQALLENAMRAFEFADTYKGAYSDDPQLRAGVRGGDGFSHTTSRIVKLHVKGSLRPRIAAASKLTQHPFSFKRRNRYIKVLKKKKRRKLSQRIHHRGSSLPSVSSHPQFIACKDGSGYYESANPNPNPLVGAVVGGPGEDDVYEDDRADFRKSEPTTYINAPLVGVLAYFVANPNAGLVVT
ncbi:hypothetical protein B296_00056327 [Ensete ventricosum]|uniref:Endoglucanase n=1 Tax=Ensete ventricosum TaxID=4639 RepID=A0A426XGQ4_ENSVE|nr:hypothetical protein B296_00056327 [Ensete ventricosum]